MCSGDFACCACGAASFRTQVDQAMLAVVTGSQPSALGAEPKGLTENLCPVPAAASQVGDETAWDLPSA